MTQKKELPIKKDATWRELPVGGIVPEGGTAAAFETGDWRINRPIYHPEKCIHCMQCWAYCPDMAIIVEDGKVLGYDLDHCKGCGICANVCPDKIRAITMVSEAQAKLDDKKKKEDATV